MKDQMQLSKCQMFSLLGHHQATVCVHIHRILRSMTNNFLNYKKYYGLESQPIPTHCPEGRSTSLPCFRGVSCWRTGSRAGQGWARRWRWLKQGLSECARSSPGQPKQRRGPAAGTPSAALQPAVWGPLQGSAACPLHRAHGAHTTMGWSIKPKKNVTLDITKHLFITPLCWKHMLRCQEWIHNTTCMTSINFHVLYIYSIKNHISHDSYDRNRLCNI